MAAQDINVNIDNGNTINVEFDYVDLNTLIPSQTGNSGKFLTTDGTSVSWGTAGAAIGSALTGGTTGSILFVDPTATLAQDNSNLFWDNTNNRLGIGTSSPTVPLEVFSSTGNASIRAGATNTSGNTFATITFYGDLSGRFGSFQWANDGTLNTGFFNVPDSFLIRAGNAASGGLIFLNQSTTGDIRFVAGGSATTNERMTIKGATGLIGFNTTSPGAQVQVNASSASTIGSIIKGAASQTANLTEWQDSAGSSLLSITAAGGVMFGTDTNIYRANANDLAFSRNVSGNQPLYYWSTTDGNRGFFSGTSTSGSGWYTGGTTFTIRSNSVDALTLTSAQNAIFVGKIGVNQGSPSAMIDVVTSSSSTVGSIIKGATSQTANLTEWQNSSGTILSQITSAGNLTFGATGTITGTGTIGLEFVNSTANTVARFTRSDGRGHIALGNADQYSLIDNYGPFLVRTNNTATEAFYIDNSGNAYLGGTTARTAPNGLTVLATGNVGIGTASPTSLVDARGTGLIAGLDVRNTDTSTTNAQSGIFLYANNAGVSQNIFAFRALSSQADGTTMQRIPLSSVLQNTVGDIILLGQNAASNIRFATGSNALANERMRIGSTGLVGIGTTSPGAQLQVNAGSASTIGSIIKGATSQTANLTEWQNSSGTALSVVDEAGNVGVGTTSPGAKVDIVGGNLSIQGSTGSYFQYYNSSNTEYVLGYAYVTAPFTTSLVNSSICYVRTGNSSGDGIVFGGTTSTLELRNSDQTAYFRGSVGIGTTSPLGPLHVDASNNDIIAYSNNTSFTTISGTTRGVTNYIKVAPSATAISGGNYALALETDMTSAPTGTYFNFASNLLVPAVNSTSYSTIGGLRNDVTHSGTGAVTTLYGNLNSATLSGASAIGWMYGAYNQAVSNVSGATISTEMAGTFSLASNFNAGATATAAYSFKGRVANTGTVTNAYGAFVDYSGAGTYTNSYGYYVGDITTGTQTNTPYSFYASDANAIGLYSAGKIGVNQTAPISMLDIVPTSSSTIGQIIKMAASQTANPLEVQNSSGTVKAFVNPSGYVVASNFMYWDGLGSSAYIAYVGGDFSTDRGFNLAGHHLLATTGEVVFNDTGANLDFRIEGDTDTNLFFVDASTDRIGFGTSSPGSKLQINTSASTVAQIIKAASSQTADLLQFHDNSGTTLASIDASGRGLFSTIRALGSGGILLEANNGTDVALLGAGGGAGATFYGGVTIDGAGTINTIELGHASDTTISRSSAGVIAVEGVVVPTISSTNTLTNKRVTPRVTSITSSATPTINTDNCDAVTITALAADITSMTTNLSGTPNNFDKLIIRIKDDGTNRAITWGASFASRGATLPTSTTANKVTTVGLLYNTVTSTWDCIATVTEV